MTKTPDAVVTEIKVRLAWGERQTQIAEDMNISRGVVSAIACGRRKEDKDLLEISTKYKKTESRKCRVLCHQKITINPCLGCLRIIEQRIETEHVQTGLDPLTRGQLNIAVLAEYRRLERENTNGSQTP